MVRRVFLEHPSDEWCRLILTGLILEFHLCMIFYSTEGIDLTAGMKY